MFILNKIRKIKNLKISILVRWLNSDEVSSIIPIAAPRLTASQVNILFCERPIN